MPGSKPTSMNQQRPQARPLPSREQAGERARGVLSRFIAERGLKATRQRDLIVDTFFRAEGHLTVEALLDRCRRVDAKVSSATVYRTLKLMVECGLASARHFTDGQTLYEPAGDRHHHDHLICTGCHRIIEFENDKIERLQDLVARKHGFTITDHKLELYGLCKACRGEAE